MEKPEKAPYILGPRADWPLLVFAPLLGLAVGLLLGLTPLGTRPVRFFGASGTVADGFIGVFITAHLALVFFRSHGNPEVFARWPWRFTYVPLALFATILAFPLARAAAAVLAVWWDVYHSSLQTFGIGRIYDRLAGNDPKEGRWPEILLNHFLYIGPILAGASLPLHTRVFAEFENAGWEGAAAWAGTLLRARPVMGGWLAGVGAAYVLGFLVWTVASGQRVPSRKVWLYVSTAATSVWAWGYNPLGMALFIMNFFHALQYFALVWRYEEGNIARVFGLPSDAEGRRRAFGAFVGAGVAYGVAGGLLGELSQTALCVTLVVSLMHFWYDGFVWSVRAGDA
ncbi:hypothetical protein EPO15_03955 [bacterium]|nr:MAG: hypothetical protein EPO15_03955 [bacterium]